MNSEEVYELFYYPGHASLAPHIVLREVDADYELRFVDIKAGAQFDPVYLQINPLNTIPSLRHGCRIMTESAAICLWLALQHGRLGGGDLLQLQWTLYLSNTVQPTLMDYHYPELRIGEPKEVRALAIGELQKQFGYTARTLGDRNTLGPEFGVADIYLFMLAYWSREFLADLMDINNLLRAHNTIRQRESVDRVLKLEGLSDYKGI